MPCTSSVVLTFRSWFLPGETHLVRGCWSHSFPLLHSSSPFLRPVLFPADALGKSLTPPPHSSCPPHLHPTFSHSPFPSPPSVDLKGFHPVVDKLMFTWQCSRSVCSLVYTDPTQGKIHVLYSWHSVSIKSCYLKPNHVSSWRSEYIFFTWSQVKEGLILLLKDGNILC